MSNMNRVIPGFVTLDELHAQAKQAGEPVVYYLAKRSPPRLVKMKMYPDGRVQRFDENKQPRPRLGIPNKGVARFDNYFLAYAYTLRLKKEAERKNHE